MYFDVFIQIFYAYSYFDTSVMYSLIFLKSSKLLINTTLLLFLLIYI